MSLSLLVVLQYKRTLRLTMKNEILVTLNSLHVSVLPSCKLSTNGQKVYYGRIYFTTYCSWCSTFTDVDSHDLCHDAC